MTDPMIEEPEPGLNARKLAMGLFLVAFGLVFLFDRLLWINVPDLFRLWPVWLIAFGVLRVAFPGRRRSRLAGFWPILIGAIFLMDVLDVMSVHDSWPLFIVGGGLLMMLRAIGSGACCPGRPPKDERPPS